VCIVIKNASGIIVRKNNNIIEINGKLYDVTTGAALADSTSSQAATKPIAADRISSPTAVKPLTRDVTRQAAKHSSSHSPKPARTLMRQAVKKPGPSLKRRFKAQGLIDELDRQSLNSVAINNTAQRLDAKRLQHAEQVAKSQLVNHFSPATTSNANQQAAWQPPVTTHSPQTADGNHPAKAIQPAKTLKTTADMLEHAVQQATSYREMPPGRSRHHRAKRRAGIGAAAVLSVALLAVAVTQNLSNVRLQIASARAGFSAGLPGYQPAGYSLGQLNYSNGVVDAQFHTSSGDGLYTITQKQSSWDTLTLRDNFVAPVDPNYQTAKAGSRIIYLYGNNNATWVSGGILYIIQANGSLSNNQLVELASSL